ATVTLSRGPNFLRLEAVNASGRGSARTVISYTPLPVEVTVDRLVVKRTGGDPILVQRLPQGRARFPAVEEGHVRLFGRVMWIDEKAARGYKGMRVRLYVNGFQQIPATLLPPEYNKLEDRYEARFETDLVLNRDE